jgi:hypothetical protein
MNTKNKMKDFEAKSHEWWEIAKNILQRNWRKIWLNIKLMKEF